MDRVTRTFLLILIIVLGLAVGIGVVHLFRTTLEVTTATAVAGTVRAYISATPAPTNTAKPTATPTPTETPPPTPTATPTPTETPPPTPTPTPTPGPQFIDNCDRSPSSEWATYGGGMWLTTNDRCLFLPTTDHQLNVAVVGEPHWEAYAIDLDLHYDRHDKEDYCGIVVLFQDERNYFYLSLGGRLQRIEWWMRVDDVLTLVHDTQEKSALKDASDYRVRVEVVNGKVVTYLDGEEQSRFSTRIFTRGLAGLLAYSENDTPQSMCAFERFQVSPLEP